MKFFIILIFELVLITLSKIKKDERLFLTNLIEKGKIREAKLRALVIHPHLKRVESYAGYVTINKLYNSNTFFWYFPSQGDTQNDPLLLWMNGGPGSTSLLALFNEHGPFVITATGTIEMRKYSWNINHNIIYIDNPVGTGFSFTEDILGYVRTEDDLGDDVLEALLQLFELFPELRKNRFFVAGESYAGKYIPVVTKAIKTHNANTKSKINLEGMVIGDAWTDPINQLNFSNFLFGIGLLDSHERDKVKKIEDKARFHIEHKNYYKASVEINSLFNGLYKSGPSLLKNLTGFDFYYNYLQSKEPEEFSRFIEWVTRYDVREAIHVGGTEFNRTSQIVAKYLIEDMSRSHAYLIAELLEDYKVLIYNGQLDIGVPFISVENFIEHLRWSGAQDYKTAVKKQWWVGNDIAGYSKTSRNLHLVVVRNAGHFVPADQPLWAWQMITRFTRDLGF